MDGFCSRTLSCLRIVTLALACMLVALPAAAQNTTGRIVGTITDPGGSAIPGATVIAVNTSTGVHAQTLTGADGTYQIIDLPIGKYTLSAQHESFGSAVTQATQLEINQTLRIDIHLAVGAVEQTVAVDAQAVQVETEVPTVGGVVSGATVQNLPLNGRNTLDLALTQPGVVPAPASTNAWVPATISIAGARPTTTNYLLDGGNNTSLTTNTFVLNPNPDMIAEFKILTSNYTAEYGRNGGGVISVVTKSGTNRLHGTLYEYLRNEDFNANDYFSNAAGLPRPILKRNQFGGTIGGPVVIPKVLHGKENLFFLFGYQGQRQSSQQVNPEVAVFTPSELNGDFSQAASSSPDPGVVSFLQANPYFQANSTLAAQGIIDSSKINPISLNFIKAGYVPSSSSGVQVPQAAANDNRQEYTGKVDFYPTENDRISATMGYSNTDALSPFLSSGATVTGFAGINEVRSRALNLLYTRTFSPTLINEARASAQRYLQFTAIPAKAYATAPMLGINITPDTTVDGSPQLAFASGMSLGNNSFGPIYLYDTSYSYSDAFTAVRGKHTFKAGFTYVAAEDNGHVNAQEGGSYTFSGPNGIGSGNDMADFLLGLPDIFQQGPLDTNRTRTKGYWAFFQDQWKLTPRLTLSLGLRYEYNTPIMDKDGVSYTYVPGAHSQRFVNAPPGLVFPGDPGAPRGAFFPYRKAFAPRFGFAWDATGTGRTSLRGGIGVFDDSISGLATFWLGGTPPWWAYPYISFTAPSSPITATVPYLSQPYESTGTPNPFPTTPPKLLPKDLDFGAEGYLPFGNSGGVGLNPNLKVPYIYQYNLSLQQQFGRNLVAEIAYLGSSAHGLLANVDISPIVPGTSTRLLNTVPEDVGACGVYDCWSRSLQAGNFSHSNYSGLSSSITKRAGNWHSLGETFFTVSYTLGHSLDNASGWVGTQNLQVPYYNHNQFYGSSDYDVRQRFVLSGGYQLPFGALWSSGPELLTNGWSLFAILSTQSGMPLTVPAQLSFDATAPGPSGVGDENLVLANLSGSRVRKTDPGHRQTINGVTGNYSFDPNSFAANPASWNCDTCIPASTAATYGTSSRNSFTGPGFTNFDLSLEKQANFFESRLNASFRVEAFDVLNHTEFWTPNAISTSALLGQVTSVNPGSPSRILQLALRLGF